LTAWLVIETELRWPLELVNEMELEFVAEGRRRKGQEYACARLCTGAGAGLDAADADTEGEEVEDKLVVLDSDDAP
jgi:hypothetical protein